MSVFPEPIYDTEENSEGQTRDKTDHELLIELIEKFNELVDYFESISERFV